MYTIGKIAATCKKACQGVSVEADRASTDARLIVMDPTLLLRTVVEVAAPALPGCCWEGAGNPCWPFLTKLYTVNVSNEGEVFGFTSRFQLAVHNTGWPNDMQLVLGGTTTHALNTLVTLGQPHFAAATPSLTAGAATSTTVRKRSVGSITISLASVEARSACGQTATMQQEEAKQYAADKATDKGRHVQAVALYRCKLASNKLPPTTSKLLKNQLQELWAVVHISPSSPLASL
ncbi:hypothetical protein V8C86DRAFT_2436605 [Haematococcus lacustris]